MAVQRESRQRERHLARRRGGHRQRLRAGRGRRRCRGTAARRESPPGGRVEHDRDDVARVLRREHAGEGDPVRSTGSSSRSPGRPAAPSPSCRPPGSPGSPPAGPVPRLPPRRPGSPTEHRRASSRAVSGRHRPHARRAPATGCARRRRRPSASTIRGGMRTPSLATAWYMPAICSMVIDRPWPMGRLPNVEPDQSSRAGTDPGLSPGQPDARSGCRCRSASSMSANRSGPTLLRRHQRADVRRLRRARRSACRLHRAVGPGVVDRAVGDPDAARDRRGRPRAGRRRLERRRPSSRSC